MKRREFLAASAAAAVGLTASRVTLAAEKADGTPAGRQLLELRTYQFASAAKQAAFEQFLARAAVPAFNRAGVDPVGVFKPAPDENAAAKPAASHLYVLLPHHSADSVFALESRLAADDAFQKEGSDVLAAPKFDPAFTRYDSTLLLAFEGFPKVVAPAKSEQRLFELRTYESHNAERAKNKVQMFNKGEFPIFGRAGMPGVFFGSAVVGANLPQLTYMVVHENPQDVKNHWKAFFEDSEWKPLSGSPAYKDNVSKVVATFLRPGTGSQI